MYFKPKTRINPEQWRALQEHNKTDLKMFYSNIDYLCVKRYNSREKAVNALRAETGWITCSQSLRQFKRGNYGESSFSCLQAWALLFGVSVADLLSRDFRAEAELKSTEQK